MACLHTKRDLKGEEDEGLANEFRKTELNREVNVWDWVDKGRHFSLGETNVHEVLEENCDSSWDFHTRSVSASALH